MADISYQTCHMEEGNTDPVPVQPAASRRVKIVIKAIATVVLLVAAASLIGPISKGRLAMFPGSTKSLEMLWDGTWLSGTSTFQLTRHNYTDRNQTLACNGEFGDDYTTADWKHDIKKLSTHQVNTMCDVLGINESFNAGNFFVTSGNHNFFGGDRAYFFERHGGHPPSNWLVHDIHGVITLGSWFGISGPVLCVKKGKPLPKSPLPATTQQPIAFSDEFDVSWTKHPGKYLNLYAADVSKVMSLGDAKAMCIDLGAACAGVTCGYDANFNTGELGMNNVEQSCTVREGRFPPGLQQSPTHEVSYMKNRMTDEPFLFANLPKQLKVSK